MVKLADTKDLKSFGSDSVPVQVRLAAPVLNLSKPSIHAGLEIFFAFLRFAEFTESVEFPSFSVRDV